PLVFIRTTWRVYTWAPDENTRRLTLGIAAGLLAHQIFGLADAFMLGTQTRLDNARSHNPSHLFASETGVLATLSGILRLRFRMI
ncbi:MAG: hypothetical protein ACE5F6_21455, partial [Anaerolineae bacterium]